MPGIETRTGPLTHQDFIDFGKEQATFKQKVAIFFKSLPHLFNKGHDANYYYSNIGQRSVKQINQQRVLEALKESTPGKIQKLQAKVQQNQAIPFRQFVDKEKIKEALQFVEKFDSSPLRFLPDINKNNLAQQAITHPEKIERLKSFENSLKPIFSGVSDAIIEHCLSLSLPRSAQSTLTRLDKYVHILESINQKDFATFAEKALPTAQDREAIFTFALLLDEGKFPHFFDKIKDKNPEEIQQFFTFLDILSKYPEDKKLFIQEFLKTGITPQEFNKKELGTFMQEALQQGWDIGALDHLLDEGLYYKNLPKFRALHAIKKDYALLRPLFPDSLLPFHNILKKIINTVQSDDLEKEKFGALAALLRQSDTLGLLNKLQTFLAAKELKQLPDTQELTRFVQEFTKKQLDERRLAAQTTSFKDNLLSYIPPTVDDLENVAKLCHELDTFLEYYASSKERFGLGDTVINEVAKYQTPAEMQQALQKHMLLQEMQYQILGFFTASDRYQQLAPGFSNYTDEDYQKVRAWFGKQEAMGLAGICTQALSQKIDQEVIQNFPQVIAKIDLEAVKQQRGRYVEQKLDAQFIEEATIFFSKERTLLSQEDLKAFALYLDQRFEPIRIGVLLADFEKKYGKAFISSLQKEPLSYEQIQGVLKRIDTLHQQFVLNGDVTLREFISTILQHKEKDLLLPALLPALEKHATLRAIEKRFGARLKDTVVTYLKNNHLEYSEFAKKPQKEQLQALIPLSVTKQLGEETALQYLDDALQANPSLPIEQLFSQLGELSKLYGSVTKDQAAFLKQFVVPYVREAIAAGISIDQIQGNIESLYAYHLNLQRTGYTSGVIIQAMRELLAFGSERPYKLEVAQALGKDISIFFLEKEEKQLFECSFYAYLHSFAKSPNEHVLADDFAFLVKNRELEIKPNAIKFFGEFFTKLLDLGKTYPPFSIIQEVKKGGFEFDIEKANETSLPTAPLMREITGKLASAVIEIDEKTFTTSLMARPFAFINQFLVFTLRSLTKNQQNTNIDAFAQKLSQLEDKPITQEVITTLLKENSQYIGFLVPILNEAATGKGKIALITSMLRVLREGIRADIASTEAPKSVLAPVAAHLRDALLDARDGTNLKNPMTALCVRLPNFAKLLQEHGGKIETVLPWIKTVLAHLPDSQGPLGKFSIFIAEKMIGTLELPDELKSVLVAILPTVLPICKVVGPRLLDAHQGLIEKLITTVIDFGKVVSGQEAVDPDKLDKQIFSLIVDVIDDVERTELEPLSQGLYGMAIEAIELQTAK